MTPAREAFGLPLTLLSVVLLGGIRLTSPAVNVMDVELVTIALSSFQDLPCSIHGRGFL